MASELYGFKGRGNHYGVVVAWGGFMKKCKVRWEFGMERRSLKAEENGMKQMPGAAFVQVYNKTSFWADQSQKSAPSSQPNP